MASSSVEFSQLNTSCSKMRYTFSKEARFKEGQGTSSYVTSSLFRAQKFYELPSVRNVRAAGFGYGHKSGLAREYTIDLGSAADSPSPQRYNIDSMFEEAKTKKKGYVFGESRAVKHRPSHRT